MVEQALGDVINELCAAVDEETTAQRSEHLRTRIPLSDGRLLGHGVDNEYLYAFACGSDVSLPDESPIQLILGSYRTHGTLVSSEREAVTLAIEEDLGNEVNSADMVPTPWELMERLKEQLQELPTRADLGLLRQSLALQPAVEKAPAYVSARVVAELNEGQRNAVRVCVGHDLSFIWGPPGTGKSTTVARLIQQLVLSGRRVLVTAHSNAAVDVVMLDIARSCQSLQDMRSGHILRYGYVSSEELRQQHEVLPLEILSRTSTTAEEIKKVRERRATILARAAASDSGLTSQDESELRRARQQLTALAPAYRIEEERLVGTARVVGCTLAKFSMSPVLLDRMFDAVIVDEASMALVPYVALAASRAAENLILAGDFVQLPPIVVSDGPKAQHWMKRDVWRVHAIPDSVRAGERVEGLAILTTQYRMHPDICATVSDMFYQSRLRCGPGVAERTAPLAGLGIFPDHSICAIDTGPLAPRCYREGDIGTSRVNLIDAIIAVCAAAQTAGGGDARAAIITPYAAQARLVRTLAREVGLSEKDVSVSTVHRFQGSEQDVVVFMPCEGYPQSRIGYLSDMRAFDTESIAARLLNVAISRARGKVILVGDTAYIHERLTANAPLRQLFALADECGAALHATWDQLNQQGLLPQQLFGESIELAQGGGFLLPRDLRKKFRQAERYVVACLAPDTRVPDSWQTIPASSRPGVVCLYGGQPELDSFASRFEGGSQFWGTSRSCESLLCVDGRQLLLEGVFGQQYGKRCVCVLLNTPKTIGVYLQHSGLGPSRDIGAVMARETWSSHVPARHQRRARSPTTNKSDHITKTQGLPATHEWSFAVSPCPDCGGSRHFCDKDGELYTTCSSCQHEEAVTLASLFGMVERLNVRCHSCKGRMEARWAPGHRYYLACTGACHDTVSADVFRQWILGGFQPPNVDVGVPSEDD
jgi:hypothetical protein